MKIHVLNDGGEFSVWASLMAGDPRHIPESFAIGSGATREAAMSAAIDELEAARVQLLRGYAGYTGAVTSARELGETASAAGKEARAARAALASPDDFRGQRMFSELQTGARFYFDHDLDDSPYLWTKTGRREYSRILTKRVGSTTAPVTPISPIPDEEGDAVVMLRDCVILLESLRQLARIKRDVIPAIELDALLARFGSGSLDQSDVDAIEKIVGGR